MTDFSSKTSFDNSRTPISVVDGRAADSMPLTDRGGSYGHGLFETMLLHSGALPLLPQHSARLLKDAPILGLNITADCLESNISSLLKLLEPQQLSSGIIKVTLTAGSGGRGYAPPSPSAAVPRISVQYFALPQESQQQRQKGIRVTECDYRLPLNPVLAGIKHLNRLDQVIARSEWGDEYEDGIMFSSDHQVIETTRANLFVKLASGWVTPRLDQAGVRGVMRELLLHRLFRSAGLQVKEATISREQFDSADEIFSCSSVRGLVPIIATKRTTAERAIGEDTRALQGLLQSHYGAFPC
jgi:4-amino-4-deoxychorismate lyase